MSTDQSAQNPLLGGPFATPHATVPFSSITPAMMEQAVTAGIDEARREVEAIAAAAEPPTYANTIVALERTGRLLDRALNTFYPLLEAAGSDEMDEIAMRITPLLSEYSTSIILNVPLWNRVKAVFEQRGELQLDAEDSMLLQETYDLFARNGAELRGEARESYRRLKSELGELTTKFGQNVLHELNTYELWLTADDLDGLPDSSVEAAALAAKEQGREGEYLFTLQAPVYVAFMKHSARRDLREKMWRLYNGRNIGGDFDNVELMKRIAEVRRQIAALLGHATYADYSLGHAMAKTPAAVMKLLTDLTEAYRPALEREMAELTEFAATMEGTQVEIKPWDYSYYANKLRQSRYAFDDEQLRPYFELGRVIDGVFSLATRLYGITFTPAPEGVEVYHPDVKAYEVHDRDGSYLGMFYADFFPRSNKRPGAWMTNFTEEEVTADGSEVRPHVTIVTNFTKPTEDKPSLLTPSEVRTFLHEFGHSLHGLLARTRYKSLSGTSVRRDFVELPSQFNENFLTRREFLDSFARHYVTGEPIPAALVDALIASQRLGAAYACLRQLNFGLIDMAWHTATAPVTDPVALEREAGEPVKVFEPEEGAMVSPQFSHIFAGGYAAGYYSYKWSEVLDADAFAKFEEEGVFSPGPAEAFRANILERGGTEDPAVLYRRFRGKDPTVEALLRRDGIAPA